MHFTSWTKAQLVAETYVRPRAAQDGLFRVLDVGSKRYQGHLTYREAFDIPNVEYTGLDLEPGANVDLVPASPYVWNEIQDASYDLCISGQTFEHNPFFWVTMAEVVRVLKPGGIAVVIAPGRGAVHRYPVDCWRFFPDAWSALCTYVGLEPLETLFEDYSFTHTAKGAEWCDSTLIAEKPRFAAESEAAAFRARLAAIKASLPESELAKTPGPVQRCART
ncbi:MAG: class I SAM-dependent methyltransferase [Myxococcales bacterium]|nr:class I SAM-dependent methyltransferase [Myxococcales bacterium]